MKLRPGRAGPGRRPARQVTRQNREGTPAGARSDGSAQPAVPLGVLNDDVLAVTGRPPVSFGEFAVGAVAAWRR